jgi:hypothetical protein
MQYWDIVMRSFRISWNHKYLWLIALFSGEGGGGASFNFSQPPTGNGSTPNVSAVRQQVLTWLGDHIALVTAVVILWLVLLIAFFILGAICEGATVRAAAEHDAERPFGLRLAWRMGVHTLWVIVRFRLLLIALGLPLVLLVIGLAAGIAVSVANGTTGAVVVLVLVGLLLLLIAIPYLIYLFFLDRLGTRAAILEERAARAAIVRAHRLLFKRLGRSLLVWLLSIGVSLVLGILLACVLGIVSIPFFLIGAAMLATGSGAVWVVVVIAVLLFLPVSLVIGGFLAAQGSTYWTLAFRRLDLDAAPSPQLTS